MLAGCSSATSVEGEAQGFLHAHASAAKSTAAAARAVEAQVSALPARATGGQALATLIRDAASARHSAIRASEWNPTSDSEAAIEEEDLARAKTQVTEGADELARAAAAIESYARGRAAARARYEREMARAREQWNEGISQVWFLARRSGPPTL